MKKITTKDIITTELSKLDKVPLYNQKALNTIYESTNEWKENTLKEKDKNNWCKIKHTVLGSDIPKELLYTPLSHPNFDYINDLANSGQEPYTRGVYASMYRGKEFTRRQLVGFGSPEETNERIRSMLDHGATGVSVLFDLPTIQMYDSDDPYSVGQVGMSGVCVDSVEDMDLLFKGIDIGETSISIVTHYPSNTAILFPMFLVLAEERGIPWDKLKGSVQNDITMEELVRSGLEYIPPKDCFRVQCDNIAFIRENIPKWNFVTINGYNLREFGTSSVTEMAIAISNGIEILDEMVKRGYDINTIADRLSFFWSISNDFFEEVSRLRAVRRLWYKIMKYRFNVVNPKAMLMRCHAQTSGVSLIQNEPYNNVVRSAYQALAAILGGVQSLHVDSYDEAYSVPTDEAALLSLRTQQILQAETGITDVVDPLGGSFFIETLTNEIEKRILDEVDVIERCGGYIKSIEDGKIYGEISSYFAEQQRLIENGGISIVSQNIYNTIETNNPPIDVFKYTESVEKQQKNRLQKLRLNRDNTKVQNALQALEKVCLSTDNIFPYTVECARARCTEGEMFKTFKKSFGLWKRPVFF